MNTESPNKHNGYLMDLYRDTDNGWIAGICAGLARHFDIPVWATRLIAITLLVFTGELAVLFYIAGLFLLAKRPGSASADHQPRSARPAGYRRTRPAHLFDYPPAPGKRTLELRDRLQSCEQRIRSMETYVTSRKYEFDRQMNEL